MTKVIVMMTCLNMIKDLKLEIKQNSIDLSKKDESIDLVKNAENNFDIEAIEEKVLKKNKKDQDNL